MLKPEGLRTIKVNMLEITGKDISELNDSDLRELVGLLCEADLTEQGIAVAGVTKGGHQNAKDGGLDVSVEIDGIIDPNGFIPRPVTGYQVKKPDMQPAAIMNEMRPEGLLRPVIKTLTDRCGAYIIVSGKASTSASVLLNRINAMSKAVADLGNASNLKVDFYDQDRIARWVRSHPSIILWVRKKLGKTITGWQPFGNWSKTPEGVKNEYLCDDKALIYDYTSHSNKGSLDAIEGINRIRSILNKQRSSVRLVGLSGTGKTRLLQALFDDRIGQSCLNPSQVFYTDMSDSPDPHPLAFANDLIAFKKRAFLAVDNCPPDLHSKLTSICSSSEGQVSLITVEYDVQDEIAEETNVFKFEPASKNIVENIIRDRFRHIQVVDARRIADFSNGNYRVALAIANTLKKGDSVASLTDNELFKRLFFQRNDPDSSLLKSAEVCSLVYSFDSRSEPESNNELSLIASLAGKPINELYSDIAELKRRDVIQQSNIWKAVLPQAVANRLAKKALEDIPTHKILAIFESDAPPRLLKSFAKRLGFLHDSEQAIIIVNKWLGDGGRLSNLKELDNFGFDLLRNITPVLPEKVLEAIERAATGNDGHIFTSRKNLFFTNIIYLLRSIGYDPVFFDRCVDIMIRFALSENTNEKNSSIRNVLRSLFYIRLSGTNATLEQRLFVIKKLLYSEAPEEAELGLFLAGATLETWHFSSVYGFDFGARPRAYGYSPESTEEIRLWFSSFLELVEPLVFSSSKLSESLKILLAEKFRGLFLRSCASDDLVRIVKAVSTNGSWIDAWIAVKITIKHDSIHLNPELLGDLKELEKLLSPKSLIDRARAYVFSSNSRSLEVVSHEGVDPNESIELEVRRIGRDVANDNATLDFLLPEIFNSNGFRVLFFGQGLAEGSASPLLAWQKFRQYLVTCVQKERVDLRVLDGFLKALSEIDNTLSDQILDEAVADEFFAEHFVRLQTSVLIDENGFERLKSSLKNCAAPVWSFINLAHGRAHDGIDDENLAELLLIIASKPEGYNIAIEILHMRYFGKDSDKEQLSETLINVGRKLLSLEYLQQERQLNNHNLSEIVKMCLKGKGSETLAKELCLYLAQSIAEYKIYPYNCSDLLASIARLHPKIFLDTFFEIQIFDRGNGITSNDFDDLTTNPFSVINEKTIIDWCEVSPEERYSFTAEVAELFVNQENEVGIKEVTWSSIANAIINRSPEPIKILNIIRNKLAPLSWSGSRANIMGKRLPLIEDLKQHQNKSISNWAVKNTRDFFDMIERQKACEKELNQDFSNYFE